MLIALNTLYSSSNCVTSARLKIRDNCVIEEITTKVRGFSHINDCAVSIKANLKEKNNRTYLI